MHEDRIPKRVLLFWAVLIIGTVWFWLWAATLIDEWLAIPAYGEEKNG